LINSNKEYPLNPAQQYIVLLTNHWLTCLETHVNIIKI